VVTGAIKRKRVHKEQLKQKQKNWDEEREERNPKLIKKKREWGGPTKKRAKKERQRRRFGREKRNLKCPVREGPLLVGAGRPDDHENYKKGHDKPISTVIKTRTTFRGMEIYAIQRMVVNKKRELTYGKERFL